MLLEERFGKIMADKNRLALENKDLQKDLRDLHSRLSRLQENNVRNLISAASSHMSRIFYSNV